MHIEMWPIDRPTPYENNPREISEEGLAKIVASIREYGFRQPVVVDGDGIVIVGHTRLRAAKLLGLSEVPVHVAAGLTAEQAAAYRLADNRTNEEASWIKHLVAQEMEWLKDAGFSLDITGFDVDEINRLLLSDDLRERAEDAPPLPEAPVSRAGDVWLLGPHRLACGDCTDAATVEAVLAGARPHLMVTDPPYGVEYDASWRNTAIRKDGSKIGRRAVGAVLNDDRADWRDAWRIGPAKVAYVWHADKRADEVGASLRASGFRIRAQIIWAKPRFVIGRGDYHQAHEPCWFASKGPDDEWQERFETEHEVAAYAVKPNHAGQYRGGRKQSTVWQIAHTRSDTGHSTQKPIECMQRPIENNSKAGDGIYEPFSGSGTTLMAAELTGRICYAIELNPGYVDVACDRYRNTVGREPILEATGQTMAQVKKERHAPLAMASTEGEDHVEGAE